MELAIRWLCTGVLGLCLLGCAGSKGEPACEQDLDCDDQNPCTVDVCDADQVCTHSDNQDPCDDGNACTDADVCSSGTCTGSALACEDGNPCTDDSCDPATGCVFTNNTAACDDSDACTTDDTCAGGSCQPGTAALVCDDGNPCTDDACDPATGCTTSDNTAACDDSDACTLGDVCSGGACQAGPDAPVCDDSNPCTDDSCEAASGCVFADNTAACDDEDACTELDVCLGGTCAGSALVCDDANPCTDDACDPATGCTTSDNTAACDDSDACTLGDVCAAGTCQPGPDAPMCDDGNPCTDDACDPLTGCGSTNNTAACDDGDACTVGDACAGGSCAPGGSPLDCDDANACTQDGCDPASGCTHDDISAACEDGLGCTLDTCDPAVGCINQPCSPYATCQADTCTCGPGYLGDGFDCFPACGDGQCAVGEDVGNCPIDCDFDMVVVVEDALAGTLQASLDQYIADAANEGLRVYTIEWTGGDHVALRSLLIQQVAERAVEGAWLVGDFPAAWYQQVAFDTYEEFPLDVYLMDLDDVFTDGNGDGMYDAHSQLVADIYVSRLDGSQDELLAYFAKIHSYRVDGPVLPTSAFIFMDDDWAPWSGTYGVQDMYTSIDLISDPAVTTRDAYLARMTGAGAEYVFQWIHSYPTEMVIYGVGGGSVTTTQVRAENHKATFINQWNCSAARFTQPNLGMTYLMGTDYVLATVGSTKTGAMDTPHSFHSALGGGQAWGPSFKHWHNVWGWVLDDWSLGMVILGDPLLTVSADVGARLAEQPDPIPVDREDLREIMVRIARDSRNGTYAEYLESRR